MTTDGAVLGIGASVLGALGLVSSAGPTGAAIADLVVFGLLGGGLIAGASVPAARCCSG